MTALSAKIKKLGEALEALENVKDTYNSLGQSLELLGNKGVTLYTPAASDVVNKVKNLGSFYKAEMNSMKSKISEKKEKLEGDYEIMKKEDEEYHKTEK